MSTAIPAAWWTSSPSCRERTTEKCSGIYTILCPKHVCVHPNVAPRLADAKTNYVAVTVGVIKPARSNIRSTLGLVI